MSKVIYAVDDDIHIRELLDYSLTQEGFTVETFASGKALDQAIQESKPDLILLDVMLPDDNGFEICKKLRKMNMEVPIIMLTAKSEEIDKILGLEIGADDFITKPFSVRELVARINARLRKPLGSSKQEENIIKFHDIEIHTDRYEVYKNGKQIGMTLKEYELLKLLCESKGRVLTRDYILSRIWGYDYIGESRTIDVHIRQIRKRLGDENETYIETVRGIGYKTREGGEN